MDKFEKNSRHDSQTRDSQKATQDQNTSDFQLSTQTGYFKNKESQIRRLMMKKLPVRKVKFIHTQQKNIYLNLDDQVSVGQSIKVDSTERSSPSLQVKTGTKTTQSQKLLKNFPRKKLPNYTSGLDSIMAKSSYDLKNDVALFDSAINKDILIKGGPFSKSSSLLKRNYVLDRNAITGIGKKYDLSGSCYQDSNFLQEYKNVKPADNYVNKAESLRKARTLKNSRSVTRCQV